jgi:protein TonB
MNASTYLQPKSQRKLMGLAGVVVLHALLFAALQAGLHRTVAQKLPTVVQALLLEEKRPELPPPPAATSPPQAPLPKNSPPPPTPAPPAEVPALAPPNATSAVATLAAPVPAPVSAPAAPTPLSAPAAARAAPPTRTAAGVNMAVCEKPEYPSASRRMEEEGNVRLKFLVGVDGKVIQSEIEQSSGYKRLDEAARAGLAKCLFRPAMVDGKPEQAWTTIQYVWRLE